MADIGLIDADLLDNGTRHPNLALMKISDYYKGLGHNTRLLCNYGEINQFDEIFMSKVFNFTKIPPEVLRLDYIHKGGTGFDESPDLPPEIEHAMPDYTLYDEFIEREIARGIKASHFSDYKHFSIGFATKGCFRKCSFCVNKKYEKAFRHAPVSEFFDPSRKYIYLWDDNILAFSGWREVFKELAETGRYFQFRQGLDLRLMTEEKAKVITKSKYKGDFIFAFDDLEDRELIIDRLTLWRRYTQKTTKLYVLTAYKSQDLSDIIDTFERIKIIMSFKCLPYIMRYEDYKKSEFRGFYITLARWCNQPNFFKKKSFREFCLLRGDSMRYLEDFWNKFPEIAKQYFDLKFPS